MKALPLSEQFFLLGPNENVTLHVNSDVLQCTINSLRKSNRHFILSFHEVTDRDVAARYRGALLFSPVRTVAMNEGEFFYEQIIGLTVVSKEGREIGKVVDIFDSRAHDVYVVRKNEKEYLIPAVREFICDIQLAEKKIVVNEMEGLFD